MINQKNKIFQSRFLIIKYSVPTILIRIELLELQLEFKYLE